MTEAIYKNLVLTEVIDLRDSEIFDLIKFKQEVLCNHLVINESIYKDICKKCGKEW